MSKLANALGLYLEGIQEGHYREAMAKYTGARYRQHSTGVPDGKAGFISFFEEFTQRHPQREMKVLRQWEDGPYVFVQVLQILDGGTVHWVTYDFFLTDDDDKLIEHWDIIVPYAPGTPTGEVAIDGPTEPSDLPQTDANRAVVRGLIEQVWSPQGDPAQASAFISAEQYREHDPRWPDGLPAFEQRLSQDSLRYHEIVLLVARGNFVATLCKTTLDGQPYAHADVFRLADGKVVEHWVGAEPVPEKPVNEGKF